MVDDPELAAMATVKNALENLDQEIQRRVLLWAMDRFKVTPQAQKRRSNEGGEESFKSFGDLYNAADPKKDADRALVGGYWLQKVQEQEAFSSGDVNKDLKNLGHNVSNITSAFSSLMHQKPRLAMQVRKSGSSKQARKQYKLTREGLNRVEAMLRHEDQN